MFYKHTFTNQILPHIDTMNIYMVNVTKERQVHRSSHPKVVDISHNPYIVWAPVDEKDDEYCILDDIKKGDIIVQYYTKGKYNYFIFGRARGTSFPYQRSKCYSSKYCKTGLAISIGDVTSSSKIKGDVMEEIFKYMDQISYDIDHIGCTWVNRDLYGSGWEYDRSFINLKGKDYIWRVAPGLSTIMEDQYIFQEIPLDKVGILVRV